MKMNQPKLLPTIALAALMSVGCGHSKEGEAPTASAPAGGEAHAHPTEGPHHGSLIELGDEEYHAELVHDDEAGVVTIYLLDSAAKAATPIEAPSLLVNLSHDGSAEQFTLAAAPDAGDPAGKSSKFTSSDKQLAEELDHEGVEAQLVVEIAGKQYRGAIEHHHDHAE